jgi:hypothetical protein
MIVSSVWRFIRIRFRIDSGERSRTMMIATLTLSLLLASAFPSSGMAQISRQECVDQGGEVIGDIGDGSIFQPDYLCANTNRHPTDIVVAQEGEPIALEGEVCCGGTGQGIGDESVVREEVSRQECTDRNGTIVGDIGDGAIHNPDYVCESSGLPPIGTVIPQEGEPIAREGEVCCGLAVIFEDPLGDETLNPEREEISRQECENRGGQVIGDIGDGRIHRADFVCETDGEPPIATVVPLEGEPISTEGEVCCGDPAPATSDGDKVTTTEADENSLSGAYTLTRAVGLALTGISAALYFIL